MLWALYSSEMHNVYFWWEKWKLGEQYFLVDELSDNFTILYLKVPKTHTVVDQKL